jgi:hypothetical protein
MTAVELIIDIGVMPIAVRTESAAFLEILENRYGGFVNANAPPVFTFGVEIVPPGRITDEEDLSVRFAGGRWVLERGDFHAECDMARGYGTIRQSANPYAIDAALRIVHSLLLAEQGGLLVHAASAIRNGRAFLFAGVSGAGKTTIARLAPPDVTLLTDEISYVRGWGLGAGDWGQNSRESEVRSPKLEARSQERQARSQESGVRSQEELQITNHESPIGNAGPLAPRPQSLTPSFQAFGTPFAGELGVPGANVRAPLAAVYLLAQGPENRIEEVGEAQAVRALLADVLFFADDSELVRRVFDTACVLVKRVPVRRLVFMPDRRVWEMIV